VVGYLYVKKIASLHKIEPLISANGNMRTDYGDEVFVINN